MARNLSGAKYDLLYNLRNKNFGPEKVGNLFSRLISKFSKYFCWILKNKMLLSSFCRLKAKPVPNTNFSQSRISQISKKNKFLLSLPSFFSRLHATVLPRHLIKKKSKIDKFCFYFSAWHYLLFIEKQIF